MLKRFSVAPSYIEKLVHERIESRFVLAQFARGQLELPSEIVAALRRLSIECLLFMMAKTAREQTRSAIAEYINVWRHVKPLLTGKGLIAIGYQPGPVFSKILTALRNARLDGKITSVDDEIKMVKDSFSLNSSVENYSVDRATNE